MNHLHAKKPEINVIFSKKRKKYFSRLLIFKVAFSFLILFSLLFFIFQNSSAAELTTKRVIISDSRKSVPNVGYNYQWTGSTNNLKCFKILFCTTLSGGCTTPNGLNTTSSTKGTWSGLTVGDWVLNNSTNGTFKLTNSVGETPATNLSLEFLGITNPSSPATYFNRITTYSDEACLTQVDFGDVRFKIVDSGIAITAVVTEIGNGGGGGGGVTSYATVVFEGRAYPGAFLTVLKNNKVAATFTAESSGLFKKELTGIAGGIYSFGIFAEDTEGRKSVTLSFTISILGGKKTTVSGIFLSPTISLTPTQVEIGGNVNISGQVFPESKVNIFISSKEMVKETNASKQGKWNYQLDTSALEISEHEAKSMALFGEGEQSLFSQTLYFLVLKKGAMVCKGADLNFDGKVNIIDFSILLYFWNKTQPGNRCVDINFDGIVDIFDFSIMMYWWGG